MRLWHLTWTLVTTAACSSSTGVDSSLIEYSGPLAGTFAESYPYPTNPEGPPICTTYSTLSGTVRVKLAGAGQIAGADAGVDITERVIGASPGCSSSREVRPFGEWTAPVTGTSSRFGFTMSKTSSGQTTTITFDGSITNNTIVGALTYARSKGAASGMTTFNVSLPIAQNQEYGVSGSWTGNLTFVRGGDTITKATVLALTQSNANVTGQLRFGNDEILSVEGTVAGATVAIRATPQQVGDGCDRHSIGITFTIGTYLTATSATGTACEGGGQSLALLTSASGTLTR